MNAKYYLSAGAIIVGCLVSGQAFAGTQTGTIAASLTVDTSCSVTTSDSLSFSDVTNGADDQDTSVDFSVTCTVDSPYTIALAGANDADGAHYLSYTDGDGDTHEIQYELYQDESHDTAWGTDTDVHEVSAAASGGDDQTAYAVLPSFSGMPAGDYSDTITVTVSF